MALAALPSVERHAWRPPERIGPAEWAERYRVLRTHEAATAGPYRCSRAPYVRGVFDALRTCERVVLVKPAQWGGTEIGLTWLGWIADVDPGPVLVAYPTQEACRDVVRDRLTPMFRDTPRLTGLLTGERWDLRNGTVKLRSCAIKTGWSGSATSLASRAVRYGMADEIDKFAPYVGREADAVSLLTARLTTYRHRARLYLASTPTVQDSPILREAAACEDQRDYQIRCPACSGLTLPDWGRVSFRGKEASEPDELAAALAELPLRPAVLACECGAELTHEQVWAGVLAGEWVSRGPVEAPRSVAFHGSGLVSPWTGLDLLAAEWLRARAGGLEKQQHWHNSLLGAPFWASPVHGDETTRVTVEVVAQRAREGGPPGEVPPWALAVVAGADTAGVGHQYVVRAYGPQYRSQLLEYGHAPSGAELLERVFRRWGSHQCVRLCVDAGGSSGQNRTRTDDVYALAAKDPRVWPVKGHGGAGQASKPLLTAEHQYGGRAVRVSTIDTLYYKDLLAGHVLSGAWLACPGVGHDYLSQIASERRVLAERRIDARSGTEREVWRWVPNVRGGANHWWDSEVYALVSAYMLGAGARADERPALPAYAQRPEQRQEREAAWRIGR